MVLVVADAILTHLRNHGKRCNFELSENLFYLSIAAAGVPFDAAGNKKNTPNASSYNSIISCNGESSFMVKQNCHIIH